MRAWIPGGGDHWCPSQRLPATITNYASWMQTEWERLEVGIELLTGHGTTGSRKGQLEEAKGCRG